MSKEPLSNSTNSNTKTEDALRKTYEHIYLVSNLLMSAQIELMKRQATHDRTKLVEPEWGMFAQVTHKLEGLTYGSEEYETQRKEMLTEALGHHYEHNRHHPEFYPNGINDMNLFDVLEMLVDWMSASKRDKDGSIHKSIQINKERFNIDDQLTQILINTIPWLVNQFEPLHSQKDLLPPS